MHTVLLSCVDMLQARRHKTIHIPVQVVIQSPFVTCAVAVGVCCNYYQGEILLAIHYSFSVSMAAGYLEAVGDIF